MTNEHGSFFDSYKDIMVLWSFAVISFMFLCVSFLRIIQRAFLYLPSSFELYDPNEWYNGSKKDPEIHEEARRFINKKMLKGPQYKKIVLAHWMRIVSIFWLVVSNLAIICYVGPRVAFCVFEMLLLYWDVVAYSSFSGLVTENMSALIYALYFAAVTKVLFSSVLFLNPIKEMLIRTKFHHSVALFFFHQFIIMFTQLKYTQGMASLVDSPEDMEVANALKMKAEFMIFLSIYCMMIITYHQVQKDWKERIGRVEAVLWNCFLFTTIIYNVLIVFALKKDPLIPSECSIISGAFLGSTACFGLFDKILALCALVQIPFYIYIAVRALFPAFVEEETTSKSEEDLNLHDNILRKNEINKNP